MPDFRFRCLGPFPFPWRRAEDGKRLVHHLEARNSVFAAAEGPARVAGIDIWSAVGLYVMGLSPPGGPVTYPYYVGQAAGQTLYERCFQRNDKPRIYSAILNQEYQRATPFMYLLPLVRLTEGPDGTLVERQVDRGARGRVPQVINDAEYMVISMAMQANRALWNVQHRTAIDRFEIDGTPHTHHHPAGGSRAFAQMMGFVPPATLAAIRRMERASRLAKQAEPQIAKDLRKVEEATAEPLPELLVKTNTEVTLKADLAVEPSHFHEDA